MIQGSSLDVPICCYRIPDGTSEFQLCQEKEYKFLVRSSRWKDVVGQVSVLKKRKGHTKYKLLEKK
jgi:hypothetical protein